MKTHDLMPYFEGSRADLIAQVEPQMSAKRFAHVLRVETMALELAKQYDVDETLASIAALTHDYAKERPDTDFLNVIAEHHLDPELKAWGNNVWHGVVGAYLVAQELHIHDARILTAIQQHTVGGAYMSPLSQILYMADYIESGRTFPGVEEVRALAFTDLAASVGWQTQHTLNYLITQKLPVYPGTLQTYNVWSTKHD